MRTRKVSDVAIVQKKLDGKNIYRLKTIKTGKIDMGRGWETLEDIQRYIKNFCNPDDHQDFISHTLRNKRPRE